MGACGTQVSIGVVVANVLCYHRIKGLFKEIERAYLDAFF